MSCLSTDSRCTPFDIEYVKDHKIIVRNAVSGETIQTLDGVDRTLSEDMLVIADSERQAQ